MSLQGRAMALAQGRNRASVRCRQSTAGFKRATKRLQSSKVTSAVCGAVWRKNRSLWRSAKEH